MEDSTANMILIELREFREENNKRWEENDKRWEQNEKRWEENDKRWEQNEKRWEENDKRWEKNNKILDEMNQRINKISKRVDDLEEGRNKDKNGILVVLETMEKSINNQFVEMKEYIDKKEAKFDKIFAAQRVLEIDNEEFKKIICIHEKRINFYNARLKYLEEWKQQFDMGEYTAV